MLLFISNLFFKEGIINKLIEMNSLVKKGNQFLNSDFNTYKNELINNYLKQINELESSYEESYNRNINMLSYIQILINNYDELIKYYNKYNIVESVKIEDIKSIKTITGHTGSVILFFILKMEE